MFRRKPKVSAHRSGPDRSSFPLATNQVLTPGWWRLEIIWTDERGKQIEYFDSYNDANERRELLTKRGLVTHLFCALPTITWRLVERPYLILCGARKSHRSGKEELFCCLPGATPVTWLVTGTGQIATTWAPTSPGSNFPGVDNK